jgi:hypothetical protein
MGVILSGAAPQRKVEAAGIFRTTSLPAFLGWVGKVQGSQSEKHLALGAHVPIIGQGHARVGGGKRSPGIAPNPGLKIR